jgi:hypothetical protein
MNESSVLNDQELWHISFSDDNNDGESSSDIDNAHEGPVVSKKKKRSNRLNEMVIASEAER